MAEVLSSPENRRVKAVVKLRQHRHREREALLIAEGPREVARALGARLEAREVFICLPQLGAGSLEQVDAVLAAHHAGLRSLSEVGPTQVTSAVMGKMAYRQAPEGILGVFVQPQASLEALDRCDLDSGPLLLAVGLEKPGNLGAMARTAAAAGAPALLLADSVVDAFNPNAIRASTGAVFTLPILGGSASEVRAALHQHRIRLAVTSPRAPQRYTDCDLTGRIAIAIGAEDQGLDEHWLAAADISLSLPMHGEHCDSLNASVTAGIVLYESVRQRAR